MGAGEKIVLIPHPASGNVREEFSRDEITIIGQVVGVLYPDRQKSGIMNNDDFAS
jgi:hypothetical protein